MSVSFRFEIRQPANSEPKAERRKRDAGVRLVACDLSCVTFDHAEVIRLDSWGVSNRKPERGFAYRKPDPRIERFASIPTASTK